MGFLGDWVQWLPQMLAGLGSSLILTSAAIAAGFPLGLLLALGVMSRKILVRAPVVALVEIGRGVPLLVILYFFYFGLPNAGITLTSMAAAICGMTVASAAYSSEYIRAALLAVPIGEIEAASALGMSRRSILRRIILPQGLRLALPPLSGVGVQVFQGSALAFSIAFPELMARAYAIGSLTFNYFSVLVFAGCLYLVITFPSSWFVHRLEERMNVYGVHKTNKRGST